ncbi:hypothetical protein VNO77_21197 [Canavalia gladiata]|uniref:Uncharacterized protein n=1 Tax=Canavalia gladiata TaxID=3824 RepID=A0AAN9LV57_CANGL
MPQKSESATELSLQRGMELERPPYHDPITVLVVEGRLMSQQLSHKTTAMRVMMGKMGQGVLHDCKGGC